MADILLQKPAAGQTTSLLPQSEDRLVFEFDSAEATLTRDGDNLVMSFEDGASVNLTDFYVSYTSENMPTFLIQGTEVDGESFFAALDEELMPAAGAGAGTPQGSGSSVDTIAGSLLAGIDRLGRLDQEYPDPGFEDEIPEGAGVVDNAAPTLLGFREILDGNDDNHPHLSDADMFVTEAGVGRDDSGSLNNSNPNKVYDGDLEVSIQIVATDADGDSLTYSVSGTSPYGSVSIDPNTGVLTFKLYDNDLVNGLNPNQVIEEFFTVTVSDSQGATDTAYVKLAVVGTNDRPVLGFVTPDSTELAEEAPVLGVTEDTSASISGEISSTDADRGGSLGDAPTYFVSDKDTFDYFDNDAAADTNNDGVISESEDANSDLALSGLGKEITGDFGTFTLSQAPGSENATYTYTLQAKPDVADYNGDATDPRYLEDLDRYNKVQALGEGETREETFYVYVQDTAGAWVAKPITVTITGSNDGPTDLVATPSDAIIYEAGDGRGTDGTDVTGSNPNLDYAGDFVASGTLSAKDVDANDELTFEVVGAPTVAYSAGTAANYDFDLSDVKFSITNADRVSGSDDTATYKFELTDPASINKLAHNETITLTYTVQAKDPSGAVVDTKVTITLTGTNDQPTLKVSSENLVLTEDIDANKKDNLVFKGTSTVVDPDNADTQTFFVGEANQDSTKPLDTDSLTAKNDDFSIEMFVNEKADATIKATVTIDKNGEYKVVVDDKSVQHLGEGESATGTFTIYVQDKEGAWSSQDVTVTVNGQNDGPTDLVATPSDAIIYEAGDGRGTDGTDVTGSNPNLDYAGDFVASGTLSAKDVDANDDLTFTARVDGSTEAYGNTVSTIYGDLTITNGTAAGDRDAEYSFTLAPTTEAAKAEIDALAHGQTKDIKFDVQVSDGKGGTTTTTLTVTVVGTNDQPILTVSATNIVLTEDIDANKKDNLVFKGTSTVVDPDNADTQTFFVGEANQDSTKPLDTDSLTAKNDDFSIEMFVNEKADATIKATVTIDKNGEYKVVVDDKSVQHLGEGESATGTFTIYVQDSEGAWSSQDVTVTVNGQNDGPKNIVVTPIDAIIYEAGDGRATDGTDVTGSNPNLDYAGDFVASGTLSAKDVDANDDLTFTARVDGSTEAYGNTVSTIYGDLTITNGTAAGDRDAEYSFTLAPTTEAAKAEIDALAHGQTKDIKFDVQVSDGKGGTTTTTLTVTVVGTNDQPILTVSATNIVLTEDIDANKKDNLVFEGTSTVVDPDNADTQTFFVGEVNQDNAKPLDTDSLTAKNDDFSIEMFVNGKADATIKATVTIDKNGEYKVVVDDKSVQHLGEGESATGTFTIYVQDKEGAWSSQDVTVTVNGQNDGPTDLVATPSDAIIYEAGDGRGTDGTDVTGSNPNLDYAGDFVASGTLSAKDVDANDDLTFTARVDGSTEAYGNTVSTIYGDLTITNGTAAGDRDAEYSFTLAPTTEAAKAEIDALAHGQTKDIKFDVQVSDGKGGTTTTTLTVTVVGTNDQPILTVSATNIVLTEDIDANKKDNLVFEGTSTVVDPDNADTQTFFVGEVNQDNATLLDTTKLTAEDTDLSIAMSVNGAVDSSIKATVTVDEKGNYKVTVDNDSIQHLTEGENATGSFTIYVQDKEGAWSSQEITVTVQGANDAPSLTLNQDSLTTFDAAVEGTVASGYEPKDNPLVAGNEGATATANGGFTAFGGDELTSLTIAGKDAAGKSVVFDLTTYTANDLANLIIYGEHGNLSNITYDEATGEVTYTYTQTKVYDHDETLDNKTNTGNVDSTAPSGYDSSYDKTLGDSFTVTVTDKDGESQSVDIKVNIVDDMIDLRDTDTTTTVGTFVAATATDTAHYLVVTDNTSADHGKVGGTVEFGGADGLVSMEINPAVYNGTVPFAATVIIDGQPKVLTLVFDDAGNLLGVEGNEVGGKNVYDTENPYFTFTIDDDGNWTFEQHRPFGGDVVINVKGTDADGDSDTHNIVIRADDKPFIDTTPQAGDNEVHVSEVFLGDGSGNDPNTTDEYKGNVASKTIDMNVGEDGYFGGSFENAFSWATPTATLTSNGEAVQWDTDGNPLVGYTGSKDDGTYTEVITVTMGKPNAQGKAEYDVVLKQPVEHPNADGNNEITDLDFGFSLKDADGDEASGSITVNIEDDVPTTPNKQIEPTLTTTDTALTIVDIDFGADNGDGKQLIFGGTTFTFMDGAWTVDAASTGEVVDLDIISANGAFLELKDAPADGDSHVVDGTTFTYTVTDGSGSWSATTGEGSNVQSHDVTESTATRLEAADGTTLQTGGADGDRWLATVTDVPTNGEKTETFEVIDADGDKTSFDITAQNTTEIPDDKVIGLAGSATQIEPGANYNIAIILDTSGSMYDDGNNDIDDVDGQVISRLGQACDAIADFIVGTLHNHANSELGGEVNVLITTFWRGSDIGATEVANSVDKQSSSATYIETLDPADFAGMSEDQIYSAIAEILAMNAVGVTYDAATGEFEYDSEAHKALTEALKDPNKDADDVYKPLDGGELGFHWGTEYHQGFETAAAWFEQVSQEGFINEAFLITDGAPHDTEAEREKAYTQLLEAMGITYTQAVDSNGDPLYVTNPTTGNPILIDGNKVPINRADPGQEDKIQAVGVGAGANLGTLDKFDTTEVDPNTGHNSVGVSDSDISQLFTAEKGSVDTTTIETSIGITATGKDVLVGGMNVEFLRSTLQTQLGMEISDTLLAEYMRNNPEWVLEQTTDAVSTKDDPDLLMGGSNNDIIYGQGGADMLIGDGSTDKLAEFAEKLGLSKADYEAANLDLPDLTGLNEQEIEAALKAYAEKMQDLVTDLTDAGKEVDLDVLRAAADAMESNTDGNDTIYGGDIDTSIEVAEGERNETGDDILLGLGGDDKLYGGEGNDILIGGSGADTLIGGGGDDIILGDLSDKIEGGDGKDLIILPELENVKIDDLLSIDGGADMDVLLAGAGSLDGVTEKLINGDITNVELLVFGADLKGNNVDDIMKELDVKDDEGKINSNWQLGDSVTGNDGTVYEQYKDGDITILVSKSQLESGNW